MRKSGAASIAILRLMRQRSQNGNLIGEEEFLRSGVCGGGSLYKTQMFFFFDHTPVRNKPSPQRIILKHVKTNTRVISDEWRGYLRLKNIMTPHDTICHKKHFVDPRKTHSGHQAPMEKVKGVHKNLRN